MPPDTALAVELVHAVPGRIRLRIPAIRHDRALADRIIATSLAHPGVSRVRVSLASGSVIIEGKRNPDLQLGWRGLTRAWLDDGPAPALPVVAAASPSWQRLAPLGLALGGLALSLVAASALPGLGIALTALSALPIVGRALLALRAERRLSVDLLDASAVTLMLTLGDVRSAALMCALVALGEEIRERTARRSRRATLDLHQALGQFAWLVRGEDKIRVALEQLTRGDVVALYTGDLIPVDGIVVEGDATVDQKALTGESRAVNRSVGERVLAATVVTDGKIYVRAEAVGRATRAGLIVQALEQAPTYDTRAANYASQFADRLVVPTFGLAALAWALTGNVGRAAAILILDFATGIRVSAPTVVLATMTRAAHRGVLIKGGRAIERLAEVDAVVFDKTGTLTRGAPRVSGVISLDPRWSSDDVLMLAAAAEVRLRHPSAKALVRRARKRGLSLPPREDSHYTMGHGVIATVQGHSVRVGNRRFFDGAKVDLEKATGATADLAAQGHSYVYVALDEQLAGLIGYYDPPRPQAARLVTWLRDHGVEEIYMVTGDEPAAAEPIAHAVGIDRVHAATLPDDKATIVAELQRRGRTVAVVGDGINDSPALAIADVSISLKSGADVARETADVVLMRSKQLMRVAEAIQLSRDCTGLIRQNLVIVGGPNAAALLLATVTGLSPVMATLFNNGSTIVAGLNSLRPLIVDRRAKIAANGAE